MTPLFLDLLPGEYPLPDAPAFRRRQIAEWVFKKRVSSFDQMTTLPAAWRAELASRFTLGALGLARSQGSADTTRKFLWRLNDGALVESVLIPASPALYGEPSDRLTLCVSTQVGCAYGCRFCASGLDGFRRNLSPGEIVAQVMAAETESGSRVNNLVFMGMGEPLANYDAVSRAIEIINAPWGLGIGARHITISTSGLVPGILRLAEDPRQIRLAISLHGATDEVRDRIMPINRRHPIAELIEACALYRAKKHRSLTFEYILIEGINDDPAQARLLAELARRLRARVNLIPYNAVQGLRFRPPPAARVAAFAKVLSDRRVPATVRREKGSDIDAACGQLRLKTLRGEGPGSPAAAS
ncbi:MAG: 23S rRNA (adenine(2503)-C(2))-methyltransferase RlmN [Verrucomicrobiae bacterium]|nr:23S rRNA (adenine(2503)-C(2))-methyltransferase RlmN [Verrucomicrobiae bacterium]